MADALATVYMTRETKNRLIVYFTAAMKLGDGIVLANSPVATPSFIYEVCITNVTGKQSKQCLITGNNIVYKSVDVGNTPIIGWMIIDNTKGVP